MAEKSIEEKLTDLINIFNDPAGIPLEATERDEELITELEDDKITAEEAGGTFQLTSEWKMKRINDMWDKFQDYMPS